MSGGRPGRAAALVVLALAGLLLAGCRVRADVGIAVAADGSGTVTVRVRLDAAATRALERNGAALADAVRLDGLARAGWEVSAWRRRDDGASITLRKRFARLGDLPDVLAELDGAPGVIRDVAVRRSAGRLRTEQSVSMVVDLRAVRAGIAADRAVAQALTAAGIDAAALDEQASRDLRDALSVRVAISMPDGSGDAWTVRAGERRRVALDASQQRRAPVWWAVLAAVAVLGALALFLVARRSASRARARARRTARGDGVDGVDGVD